MKILQSLIAVAVLAVVSPAQAAPDAPKVEDLKMLQELGQCIVKRNAKGARRVLAMDYRLDAYRNSMRSLAMQDRTCAPFNGALRMSGVLFAGSLAEALMPSQLAGAPLASRIGDASTSVVEARDDAEFLGLCAVRTLPGEVSSVLVAAPGSQDESTAFGALVPKLGPCVRAGASAKLNKPGLRALVALAAYRLTNESKVAAAPPAGS